MEKTVENHPEFWPAYNNLALAYYYKGKTKKAAEIIDTVLNKNPGNLHALCNLAVFLFYERQTEELESLLSALEKVQPMLFEHRYKLGATFALTERYEKAYFWLRQIQKYGYDEETGFYYWLAKAAYFTGNKKVADSAWKQLKINDPDKAAVEPWNEKGRMNPQFGDDDSIMKMLGSNHLEERLYAIFYISVSGRKQELITQTAFTSFDEITHTEKIYLANILQPASMKQNDPDGLIDKGHDVALILYERYNTDEIKTRALLLAWFSAFLNGLKEEEQFVNSIAVAGAAEYIWQRERNNKQTQKSIAEQYGISQSTLKKYIQLLENYWK